MGLRSLRFCLAAVAAASVVAAGVVACGMSDDSVTAFGDAGGPRDASSLRDGGGPSLGDAGVGVLPANGVLIVHAATFGAFRLCFESDGEHQPIPSADLLPGSNLLGVDVGSVVRIDPPKGAPGKAYAFAVDDIKDLYPPGKTGPSCEALVTGETFALAHDVGTLTASLATGVHLLVLRGSAADGDLRLETIALDAFSRPDRTLPVQLLPLARDLPERVGDRKLGLAAGSMPTDGGDASVPEPFLEGTFALGVPVPEMPFELAYDPNDEAAYASDGFILTLGAADDAGSAAPREILLAQSLADIQRLSAPRALPQGWFNAASSYVLLVLGSATEADAAADDRAKLHFVAVPVAGRPTGDAAIEDASGD